VLLMRKMREIMMMMVLGEVISSMDRAAVMPPSNVKEFWRNIVRVEGADGAVSSTALSLSDKWMDVRE